MAYVRVIQRLYCTSAPYSSDQWALSQLSPRNPPLCLMHTPSHCITPTTMLCWPHLDQESKGTSDIRQ